jgi:hypothetical protein
MAWRFLVPRSIPSANAHIVNGNHAGTAHKYRTFRNVWANDLRVCKQSLGIPNATGKRLITITRLMGKGQREYDYDNLVAGSKPVLDAMKPSASRRGRQMLGAFLIVDDGPNDVQVTYLQERAANGQPGTLITVEDVP